jgi:hypothetical protein
MRSAFDLIRCVPKENYPNCTYQVFSGPGPFDIGQKTFYSKEDYKRQIQDYLRKVGITEYTVNSVSKRGSYGQVMSGYEFRFKNQEDHENLNVCFLGDKKGVNNTTLGLADHLKGQIDTYVTALRQFMDVCGFEYQIKSVNPTNSEVEIQFSGDLAAHVVSRAHRTGYIETHFMADRVRTQSVAMIRKGLDFI